MGGMKLRAEQGVDEDLHTWRGEKHKHEMEK